MALLLCCLAFPAAADPQGRVRVIDADTWEVGGERVRLFGIDAPERDQSCSRDGVDWGCGAWATDQVRARFEGAQAHCTAVTTDRYRRIVARCRVAGADVGRVLVSEGLAFAYREYSMLYDLDQKAAEVNRRGLHGSQVQAPAAFRAAREEEAAAPTDCRIKGNISRGGARIYHMPGQEHYARTQINPTKGERWFCSPEAARAAGWRPAEK